MIVTAVYKCCREYIGAIGVRGHRCVYCGTRPTYERADCCSASYQCPTRGMVVCRQHVRFDTDYCCSNMLCPGNRP